MVNKRSPINVVVLSIVTLGLYWFYWVFATSNAVSDDHPAISVLKSFGMLIPYLNVFVFWLVSEDVADYIGNDTMKYVYTAAFGAAFLMLNFAGLLGTFNFVPLILVLFVTYIMQAHINDVASGETVIL